MSNDTSGSGTPLAIISSGQVSLSKRVNEKFPPWTELLSTHEITRLMRPHRWILKALTLLGRFPEHERFRSHPIGWRRCDIEAWLRSVRRTRRTQRQTSRRFRCGARLQRRTRRFCKHARRVERLDKLPDSASPTHQISLFSRRDKRMSVTLPLTFDERSQP